MYMKLKAFNYHLIARPLKLLNKILEKHLRVIFLVKLIILNNFSKAAGSKHELIHSCF